MSVLRGVCSHKTKNFNPVCNQSKEIRTAHSRCLAGLRPV
jgi:hypothetical protein